MGMKIKYSVINYAILLSIRGSLVINIREYKVQARSYYHLEKD